MKQKFLALVEEMKQTGIAELLYQASSAKEVNKICTSFANKNQELLAKIKKWAGEFIDSKKEAIFAKGEKIENPMEVALCIIVIEDENVSEAQLFQDFRDLINAVRNIGNNFAISVANFAMDDYFYNVSAEDIFPNK